MARKVSQPAFKCQNNNVAFKVGQMLWSTLLVCVIYWGLFGGVTFKVNRIGVWCRIGDMSSLSPLRMLIDGLFPTCNRRCVSRYCSQAWFVLFQITELINFGKSCYEELKHTVPVSETPAQYE